MSSYTSIFLHVVFATKSRQRLLTSDIRKRLFSHFIATGPRYGAKVLCVNGVEDHVHLLLLIDPSIPISKCVGELKATASKWINETFQSKGSFRWQEGYAAFSVSVSVVESAKRYIENQEDHHKKKTYREELEEFLGSHGFSMNEYDKREFEESDGTTPAVSRKNECDRLYNVTQA